MKRKELQAKILAGVMTVSMAASLCPSVAMAATGSEVAADNTYSGKVTVVSDDPLSQNEWGWDDYEAMVSFDVVDGKFQNITVTGGAGYTADSRSYLNQAVSLMNTALSGQAASEETLNSYDLDAVSRATCTRKAVKEAMLSLIKAAPAVPITAPVDFSALNEAIQAAEELDGSKYTSESWSEVESKLEAAKSVLSSDDQAAVTAAAEALNAAIAALETAKGDTYVLMNIPYADFYAAEVENDVAVDAFSSATLNKSRTNSGVMAKGSYHVNADGSDITGITYPVRVKESDLDKLDAALEVKEDDSVTITVTNRGQTSTDTYQGAGALFENESYSYYVLGEDETPSYYKELTVDEDGGFQFGKAQGTTSELSGVTGTFTTESSYGDYQLDLDGMGIDTDSDTVYGVVISTTDGSGYGLRHLENIWRGVSLAWCTGYTIAVHGCPTSSEHYASMMGKTIDKVTYYTSKGILTADLEDIYVPVKFEGSVSVEDVLVSEGKTAVTVTGLPEGYAAEYAVTDAEGKALDSAKVENGVMTFDAESTETGNYTLTVSDGNGKYAELSTTFEIYTNEVPAVYDADNQKLVKVPDATEEELEAYLSGISSVAVDGKSYAASGRGAVTIINKDGSIQTDADPIKDGKSHILRVSSTGYQDLVIVYSSENVYLMMNIPYAEFYRAEVENEVDVDVFSSATKSKTRAASLAGGSYHEDASGEEIAGITYPVKVTAGTSFAAGTAITDDSSVSITVTNRGETTTTEYKGVEALFESASYSYYKLSEQPSYYKVLTTEGDGSLDFSAVQGDVTPVDNDAVEPVFSTESSYGDYQLQLNGIENVVTGDVSAVVISTEEGDSYGLRHLENIWRTYDLAWCTGFTDAVHNCPTSSAHYENMMGQTINKVTYYTKEGIYELSGLDIYVPVKFAGEVQVEDAAVTAGQTNITVSGLPEGYEPVYSAKDAKGNELQIKVDGNVLAFEDASKGQYTLTVSDQGKVYADLVTTFELYTEEIPAVYNEDNAAPALIAADG